MEKAHTKGRPYLSAATGSLLKYWAPRPSAHFNIDPVKAKDRLTERKNNFESQVRMQRHLLTWGLSHVGAGALDLQPFMQYYLHILEIFDAYDTSIGKQYMYVRMNLLIEDVENFTSTGATMSGSDEEKKKAAKDFVNTMLKKERQDILQSILISAHHKGGHPKRPAEDHQDQQVCFSHNPAEGKTCSNQKECKRQHLDTTRATELHKFKDAIEAVATDKRRKIE